MNAYVYQAALLCEVCGETAIQDLRGSSVRDTGDSGDFPQGPFPDGGGEADCPQHCDTCGLFLENPLTGDGYKYVVEQLEHEPGTAVIEWADFYDIEIPEVQ